MFVTNSFRINILLNIFLIGVLNSFRIGPLERPIRFENILKVIKKNHKNKLKFFSSHDINFILAGLENIAILERTASQVRFHRIKAEGLFVFIEQIQNYLDDSSAVIGEGFHRPRDFPETRCQVKNSLRKFDDSYDVSRENYRHFLKLYEADLTEFKKYFSHDVNVAKILE